MILICKSFVFFYHFNFYRTFKQQVQKEFWFLFFLGNTLPKEFIKKWSSALWFVFDHMMSNWKIVSSFDFSKRYLNSLILLCNADGHTLHKNILFHMVCFFFHFHLMKIGVISNFIILVKNYWILSAWWNELGFSRMVLKCQFFIASITLHPIQIFSTPKIKTMK